MVGFPKSLTGESSVGFKDPNLHRIHPNSRLSGLTFYDLAEDAQGQIWAATSSGLWKFESQGWRKQSLDPAPIGSDGEIYGVLHAGDGPLYVATQTQVYRKTDKGFTSLAVSIPEDTSITALAKSDSTGLWIGTQSRGVYAFQSNETRHFTQESGLASDAVGDLVIDAEDRIWVGCRHGADGHYWMGCNAGILLIPISELHRAFQDPLFEVHPRVFGPEDGMKASGITGVTHPAQTQDGTLWFPTRSLLLSNPLVSVPDCSAGPSFWLLTFPAANARPSSSARTVATTGKNPNCGTGGRPREGRVGQ